MILTRDPEMRRLARRILLVQMAATLGIAVLCLLVWGSRPGLSALAGGSIGVIANLYMTLKALQSADTPHGALGRIFVGQLVKVAITVGLFWVASRVSGLSWPALLVAYLTTLIAFWWVPFSSSGTVRE